MKQEKISIGGFRFRILCEDYDYMYAKSIRYKYNKSNWRNAMNFKYNNEQDFMYDERDCTGSTRVEIDVHRKGRYMYVYYRWCLDV